MEKQLRQFDEDRDFRQEIIDLIHSSLQLETFPELLEEYHSYDISNAIVEIEPLERISLFSQIDIDLSSGVFEHLETDEAIEYIKELPLQLAVKIIDHMDTDDAVDLLQYLESEEEDLDIVSLLSPKKRIELKKLWDYSEDEIGSRMSNSFIELTKSMTVKDAMKKVTTTAADTEYISILYVVSKHVLIGYLKLKQLIVARATETIEDIMETHLIFAHPHDDKEDVALKMQDYGESSMPIVDELMHMVGIVTYDDLMDIISEEKSEDYTRFAALAGDDVDIQTDTLPVRVKKKNSMARYQSVFKFSNFHHLVVFWRQLDWKCWSQYLGCETRDLSSDDFRNVGKYRNTISRRHDSIFVNKQEGIVFQRCY